jgi:hypothetical protein
MKAGNKIEIVKTGMARKWNGSKKMADFDCVCLYEGDAGTVVEHGTFHTLVKVANGAFLLVSNYLIIAA